jgi:maltose alpha-D-glucosyltransferase/alpha-amylase
MDADALPTVHAGEQSNTSALFDQHLILKLFRRLTTGTNPDLEIGRRLSEQHQLEIVPQVAGALEYRALSGQQTTLAVMHQFVANVGDAWTYTLDELDRYFERVQSVDLHEFSEGEAQPDELMRHLMSIVQASPFQLKEGEPPWVAQHVIGGYLSFAELLGRRVGELHVALANIHADPAFTAEPFTRLYQRGLYQSMRSQARATMSLLRSQLPTLADEVREKARHLLECEDSLMLPLRALTGELFQARRIRCHGDLHLGQVLFTGKDFVIIDFEGEPERPVSERRIKASPLRDVAGMLRSFHYAGRSALRGATSALLLQHATAPLELWADYWSAWISAAFLKSYLVAAKAGSFLPDNESQSEALLKAYLLEKAVYELRYEINNRPNWVAIPLDGVERYCGNTHEAATQ